MEALLLLPIVVIIAVVLVAVIAVVVMYNGLVGLRNLVQESWKQIDVELHRRHDLIPNLVETVRGVAVQERQTLESVTQARTAAVSPGSSVAEQARQEDVLTQAVGRLFAVAEAYPQLTSSQNFLQLQRDLTETEDRIAAGRRFYNGNVRALNTRVETFPPNLVAKAFGFQRAEYFEIEDPAVRARPDVDFGGVGQELPPS